MLKSTARIFAILLCCTLFQLTAAEDRKEETAAIRQRLDEYVAAYNKHDVKGVASFWAKDGDYLNALGQLAMTNSELEKIYTENFSGKLKNAQIKVTVEFLRFITPDIALIDIEIITSGVKNEQGQDLKPYVTHAFCVLSKTDGKWFINAYRSYALLEPISII